MSSDADWVRELMRLLCVRELPPENIGRAQMLKSANFPPSFYKFRVVSDYSLMNLSESTLHLACANSFNDPYDSALNYDPLFGASYAESLLDGMEVSVLVRERILTADDPIRAIVEYKLSPFGDVISEDELEAMIGIMKNGHKNFSLEMLSSMNAKIQSSYKICSLTERLDSLPLWAHYGGGHSGFAMEYDFRALPFTNLLSMSLWPVSYSGIFDATEMLRGIVAGRPFNNLFALMAALHKSPDWSYEHEWRLVIPDGVDKPSQNYSAPLKAVYLGAKIMPNDERRVRESAQMANVPVYRMHLVPHEFRMEAIAAD